jgi:serine/threonine-protein kinase
MAGGDAPWLLAGKYRMERVIGRGGMGAVWQARHVELGVDVAVKLMSRSLVADSAARVRFRREARAAARIKSAHVVAVHDFGQDGDTPYLVMELLEGETVAALLERRGKLELGETSDLVLQASAALSLAHERGVIHRDIKPSNLFLAEVEGRTVLKVLDFGIARAGGEHETSETTRDGLIVGTPAFMSPEQVNGDELGVGTDLWSLASVAYTLLTGVDPFRGAETVARIRKGVFTPPSALGSSLPQSLDDFFRTAFRVPPTERFRSAREFAAAFESSARSSLDTARSTLPTTRTLSRDDTTRELEQPRWRRRAVRVLLGGLALLGALAWFAAWGPREKTAASLPPSLSANANGRTQTTTGVSTPTETTPPSAGDDPTRSPKNASSVEPKVRSRPPTRPDPARAPSASEAPSARAPARPAVTTDPLFGLPMKEPTP